MNDNKPIWIVGLMSGTSLDGVDGAAILSDGEKIYEFGDHIYLPYSPKQRAILRSALGAWQGDSICADAERVVHECHLQVMAQFSNYELFGFHGQTLAHDPAGGRTHQLGDGAVLAAQLGVPCAWDFRSNDFSTGGQGAPLAPIYHHALVRWAGVSGPNAIINLGGVGNLTFVDPSLPPDAMLAFDTGPANAPLNDFIFAHTGAEYDADGAISAAGQPDTAVVEQAMGAAFFQQGGAKSLDRGDFADLAALTAHLPLSDGAATLVEIIAQSCARAVQGLPRKPAAVWITGGGRKNPQIMRRLAAVLPMPVQVIDIMGIDGDMVEAQAFAHLAARVKYGRPISFPHTTGVKQAMMGGVITRPK